jgi:hypothetical protein
MCCILTTLILLGPRIAALVWWLIWPIRWNAVFGGSILWPILGIIFAPWTLLVYVIAFPIIGFWNWLFLIMAIFIDVGSLVGGGVGNRDRFGM